MRNAVTFVIAKIAVVGMVLFFAGICIGGEYNLSDDARLDKAKEKYIAALNLIKEGDAYMKTRPREAKDTYEKAKRYAIDSRELYRELGVQYGINTANDISVADELFKRAAVKYYKADAKMKGQ